MQGITGLKRLLQAGLVALCVISVNAYSDTIIVNTHIIDSDDYLSVLSNIGIHPSDKAEALLEDKAKALNHKTTAFKKK